MRGPCAFLLLVLIACTSAFGQVQSRPTDAPVVTAANESWYVNGEPLQFAGDVYYPAGATVFFNGNTMVRSGNYNGVPLYTDTTIEPYSIVYVPIQRGLVRPYERLRQGALAGTVASRTPSFPVRMNPAAFGSFEALPQAAVAPTALPAPIGAISIYTPAPASPAALPVVAPNDRDVIMLIFPVDISGQIRQGVPALGPILLPHIFGQIGVYHEVPTGLAFHAQGIERVRRPHHLGPLTQGTPRLSMLRTPVVYFFSTQSSPPVPVRE